MRVEILSKNGPKVVDLNRRKAIRERCLNCSCWIPSELTNCGFSDCSLHPFRSGKGKQKSKAKAKAIRKYCLWCVAEKQSEIRKCVSRYCPLFAYRLRKLDRSEEINFRTEFVHIEGVSEAKI